MVRVRGFSTALACCRAFLATLAGLALISSLSAGLLSATELPAGTADSEPLEGSRASEMPAAFLQRLQDRKIIDAYQSGEHKLETETVPKSLQSRIRRTRDPGFVQVRRSELAAEVVQYRLSEQEKRLPLPGFKAPILEHVSSRWPVTAEGSSFSEKEQAAARLVAEHLSARGLLPVLAQTMELLGAKPFMTHPEEGLSQLRAIGFPVNLAPHFIRGQGPAESGVVQFIATELAAGKSSSELLPELERFAFRFQKSGPGFQIAAEDGREELALIRMQVGGGYRDGIVPGGTIDMVGQMIGALPDVDFLLVVPEEAVEPMRWTAAHAWTVTRAKQVMILTGPETVSSWAQDNGKSGLIVRPDGTAEGVATLVPRYASIGEGESLFLPGDSYTMDGLSNLGHRVVHSPLLFQGGNLLAVHEASRNQRLLLIGQSEIHRNQALGLSPEQVLKAFQIEFGVDQCVVLKTASYHIDFDVSVRTDQGVTTAFVNDPVAAARLIARTGLEALETSRSIGAAAAREARTHLADGDDARLAIVLQQVLAGLQNAEGQMRARVIQGFAANAYDGASDNARCFLVALDILRASGLPLEPSNRLKAQEQEYLFALKRLLAALDEQAGQFEALGWKIVRVPSLPDLYRTLNYLNGIHDRTRYVMPAHGGLYAPLDQAAIAAFAGGMGAGVSILPVRSSETWLRHGGVHCAGAAYPRLKVPAAAL